MSATQPQMLGPYELTGELGRGAMARVWRAWDPRLRREVAVKEPLFDPRLPAEVIDEMGLRFVAEAITAASLNHPNIVTIFEADVFDGRPAIVMELVEGATLSEVLERGPLDAPTATNVLEQLLSAAGYAHAHGIVHRDIKPDNVFVTTDGLVKLADFGIAHTEDLGATRLTVAGSVLGTPGYMAPEQITGGAVDARSDLFSIGVVAYEMVAGHNPFGIEEGISPTTLAWRVVNEPTPELGAVQGALVPESLRAAVMAALAKDPAARPQSAEEFRAMLHGATPGAPAAMPVAPTAVRAAGFAGGAASGNASATGDPGAAAGARKGLPSWLPYVAVAVVGSAVLLVVLTSALSGPRGSASSDAVPDVAASAAEQGESAANEAGEKDDVEAQEANDTQGDASGQQADEASSEEENGAADVPESGASAAPESADAAKPEPEPTPTPAQAFPREWAGSYQGHSSRATNYYVSRNINITFDTVGDDGTLEARCYINSYDEGEGSLSGSYGLSGSIDWATGAVHLYGSYWIDSGDLVWMRQFHGTYDAATSTIVGESSDLKDGSNVSIWTMQAH